MRHVLKLPSIEEVSMASDADFKFQKGVFAIGYSLHLLVATRTGNITDFVHLHALEFSSGIYREPLFSLEKLFELSKA